MVPMQEIESRHEHDCTIRACRDVPNLIEHIDAFASDLREARATIAELQREIEGLREHDTSVTAKLKDATEVLDWFSSVAVGQEDESLWQFVASLIWDRYYARQLYAAAERINELRKKQLEGYRQALAQRGHVAEFREDGWSLEHPVECRAIGLIDCAVNLACGYEQTAPQLGRFVVTVNEDGFLVLGERVLAGKEAQG